MSIPVVEIEHRKVLLPCSDACPNARGGICQDKFAPCPYSCAPDCPACAVEANNKAWAKYLVGLEPESWHGIYAAAFIPFSDWEQIKKLAEEKVDG